MSSYSTASQYRLIIYRQQVIITAELPAQSPIHSLLMLLAKLLYQLLCVVSNVLIVVYVLI